MAVRVHPFYAVAFEENFSLKELAPHYPGSRLTPKALLVKCGAEGEIFLYPFGAIVFHDVPAELRTLELEKLARIRPHLTTRVVREDINVREEPGAETRVVEGALRVDHLGGERTSIVALTVAQSAAMEYYERIVESLFSRTKSLVERLEKKGSVPMRTRPLHRFIGEGISTRAEVLSVLYLLDKPDEAWDDPAMDRIYDDLRSEFDLVDRFQSLEAKLKGVQESLELILDVARDRRMFTLEVIVVVLFVLEVAMEYLRNR
ncbi:MAG TPA: RMD1 family protein [bacterium]|nr:RMD1 family protein [bacterium]